jgi:uncharacterized membrane protein
MIAWPDPLHPALVHFPIAFLMAGAVAAVLSVFLRRWHLPLFAAVMLSLGAIGAVVAVATGEEEEEKVEHAIPSAELVLEEHAGWGESARNAGILAAVLALGAAAMAHMPFGSRLLSSLTACAALGSAYCVAQAGHYGGELVYRHGAGVAASSARPEGESVRSNEPGTYFPAEENEGH